MSDDKDQSIGTVDKRKALTEVNTGAVTRENIPSHYRRNFLGKTLAVIGSVFATAFGTSTTATAKIPPHAEKAKKAAREYASEQAVQKAVNSHASDLVAALAREGYIEAPMPSSLSLTTVHGTVQSYANSDQGVLITARAPNGEPSVKIQSKQQLPDGRELILIVNPDTGASRAVVRYLDSEDQPTILTTTKTSDGQVITESCSYCSSRTECSTTCAPHSCGCEKVEAQICQDSDQSCDGCFTVDYSCCGDYECNL